MLNDNDEFLSSFCSLLEDNVSIKAGRRVVIDVNKKISCIFFFIDQSAILQIMPTDELKFTYTYHLSYADEVKNTIELVKKQWNRNELIDMIIKKS
jgi:N-acetylmuramoyl-L-alanine amidase CwlA